MTKRRKFDFRGETFDFAIWQGAFRTAGMELEQEAQKQYNPGQPLPWSHLGAFGEDYLLKHYREAMKG